jgi:hypothetical protein
MFPIKSQYAKKYKVARRINRFIFTTRKTKVYTIHSISIFGLPYKEKKPIEILKFFGRVLLKYNWTIFNNELFQYYISVFVWNIQEVIVINSVA